jgi:hypothetical protein
MSNTFVSGVVDGGNDPWWGQTKDYVVLNKHVEIIFYDISSSKQLLTGRRSFWTNYSDSNPTSLCSYSLMLRV